MEQAKTIPAQKSVDGISVNTDLTTGPYFIDGCNTIAKLFEKRCKDLTSRTAHREKDMGIWKSYSWTDYYDNAQLIGLGLKTLGLERGNVVSILSEDNKEWLYCDMGVQGIGGIASGIYTTDSGSQVAYLINDSDTKFLFVENDEMLDKFLEVKDEVPGIIKVIVFNPDGLHDFSDDKVIFLSDLREAGRQQLAKTPNLFEEEINKSEPEDIGLLIYTSGTTGKPKGAMISQQNIMMTLSSIMNAFKPEMTDEQLCFLPLCHVLERNTSVYTPIVGKSTVNFAESTETVFDNMQEVSPTVFTAVPRVWEKIYSGISILVSDATQMGKLAYKLAVKAGMKRADYVIGGGKAPALVELQFKIWDFLVLRNLRRMTGLSRLRLGTSGAAPISPELLKWYRAIGVPLIEGYGQTEGSGLTTVNQIDHNKVGTVGPAIPGIELRIADDGEIQMKGGNVFPGYWNAPEKTSETMTQDGWLRTGDVGSLDDEGFLSITGRLKDIIITAGGKNITPSEIENKLKFSPYISDAVVIGDKRKYLTCLIMIDQENVEKFAQDRRIPFNNFASLCAAGDVQELIKSVVEETNKSFARVEQIKDFRLIDILLTAEDEELTATMKLKRGYVEKRHSGLIDQMYK
jgi:long-chain acyl-CoA synthetase